MKRQSQAPSLALALANELVRAGTRAGEFVRGCDRDRARVADLRLARDHALDDACHRAWVLADTNKRAAESAALTAASAPSNGPDRERARDLTRAAERALTVASALTNARDRERARDLTRTLASAQDRARILANELFRAVNLTRGLANMLAVGLASASDYGLASVRALCNDHELFRLRVPSASDRTVANARNPYGELELFRILNQTLNLHLDHVLAYASEGNRESNLHLDHALAYASEGNRESDIALVVDQALNLGLRLDRILVSFMGLDRVRDRTRELERALEAEHAINLATDRVGGRRSAADAAEASIADGTNSMPGRVPRGLVALAAQVLPAAERPRYRAEFRAELAELSRLERLGYARRIFAGAWQLRRALVEAARNADGAAAHSAEW